jgi:IS30 family transposase
MEEQIKLECWHNLGWSVREIATELGRHHTTIARELKRGLLNSVYSGAQAQVYYVERRRDCRPEGKYTESLGQLIEEKLQLTWSPEQIVGRLLEDQISVKTTYHWIYEGHIAQGDLTPLRQKGKRRKLHETRGQLNISKTIHDRPDDVKTRKTFGN